MHEAGVDADDELGAREQRRERRQATAAAGTIALGVPRRGARCARVPRRCPTAAARRSPRAANTRDQRAPVRLRPQLVGAARRVEEHDVRAIGQRAGRRQAARRARSAAVRRRRSRARPRRAGGSGRSKCWSRVDRVVHVVGERRERLADARAVGAVPRAAREPRDQRALHLLLQIEHRVVARRAADRARNAAISRHVAARTACRRQRRSATGITRRTPGSSATSGGERLLGDPVDRRAPAGGRGRRRRAPARGRCRRATTGARRGSALTLRPSSRRCQRGETHVECAASPTHALLAAHPSSRDVRAASLVALCDHARCRRRARRLPRVGAVRRRDRRRRFGQPR